MSKRANTTAILITDSAAFRADFFDSRLTLVSDAVQQIDDRIDGSPIHAIRLLNDAETPAGRRVVIFANDVWNQLVPLPEQSVAGLDDIEMVAALKYEIETLTGIDAEDCVLSATEVASRSGNRVFWVNAIPQSQWNTIVDSLAGQGVRSIEMMHPSVAQDVTLDLEPMPWNIAVWGATTTIQDIDGELLAIYQSRMDADGWRTVLESVSSEAKLSESRVVLDPSLGTTNLPTELVGELVPLSDPERLTGWLQSSLTKIQAETESTRPRLLYKPTGSVAIGKYLVQAALLMLVTVLCSWHYIWLGQVSTAMQSDIEAIREPARLKQSYDLMLQSALEKRSEATKGAAESRIDLQKVQFLFGQQTDRMERLLELLAQLRTRELVINEIAADTSGLIVSGVSINGDSAPLMANRLRELTAPMGWKIHPASQTGELKMTSGGPWLFRILFEDVGPPELQSEPISTADNNDRHAENGYWLWPSHRKVGSRP